jgi:hypothetical protein
LTDTDAAGGTVILQNEDRIVPIDHIVDPRSARGETQHDGKDLVYKDIMPPNVIR